MSNTIHGVNLADYAAATGALANQSLSFDAILNALNINSDQWTEVCAEYQFAAMTDMGTYMQYYGNPGLSPKFSNLLTSTENNANAGANSIYSQLMGNMSNLFGGADDDDDDDDDDFDIEPVPSDKKGLLAFGSIILCQHPTDTFEIYGYKSDLKDMLENSWEIINQEGAIETLEWLKEEGHRNQQAEIDEDTIEEIKEYQEALSPKVKLNIDENGNPTDIDAWDIERIGSVARYCYAAGYIDQQTCLQYLEIASKMAKENYQNWSEYAASFMTGRLFMYGGSPANFAAAILEMLNNPSSLWNTYPLK